MRFRSRPVLRLKVSELVMISFGGIYGRHKNIRHDDFAAHHIITFSINIFLQH
jgi:hypothetical protein